MGHQSGKCKQLVDWEGARNGCSCMRRVRGEPKSVVETKSDGIRGLLGKLSRRGVVAEERFVSRARELFCDKSNVSF